MRQEPETVNTPVTSDNLDATPKPSGSIVAHRRLVPLPGQPLCKHYSGATLGNLDGNYTCKCLAGVPYEIFPTNMDRWPCRRRHITGLEQSQCSLTDYGSEISADVDEQVTEMARQAVGQGNDKVSDGAERRSSPPTC